MSGTIQRERAAAAADPGLPAADSVLYRRPAEAAYFAQIEVVYRKLAGRVTPIVPRILPP